VVRDGQQGGAESQPFMEQLDAATAAELRRLGQWSGFRAEQVLTRQGEPGDAVLIVDSAWSR
jgi:hypothetical protein